MASYHGDGPAVLPMPYWVVARRLGGQHGTTYFYAGSVRGWVGKLSDANRYTAEAFAAGVAWQVSGVVFRVYDPLGLGIAIPESDLK